MAMLSAQPVFILREALQYLAQRRIVAPGYTYLQDMGDRSRGGRGPHVKIVNFTFSRRWAKITF